jgi:hypothetical protein
LPLEVTKHVPFEIDVFRAKMQDSAKTATTTAQSGGGGGGSRVPLFVLLRKCQARARAEVEEVESGIWRRRVVKVGMMIVGSLIERKVRRFPPFFPPTLTRVLMFLIVCREKEYVPALGMLDGISHSLASDDVDDNLSRHAGVKTKIQIVRFLIHLSLGTIHHAQTLFLELQKDASVSEVVKRVLDGLLGTCQGRSLSKEKQGSLPTEEEEGNEKLGMVVANNEAVALLANGDLSEVRVLLFPFLF